MRCNRRASAAIVSGSSRAASYSSLVPGKNAIVSTCSGLSSLRITSARSYRGSHGSCCHATRNFS